MSESFLESILERIRGRTAPDPAESARLVVLAAATLMFEVAWADHDISDGELDLLRRALNDQFGLTGAELDAIIAESRSHQEQSVGLQAFTRTLVEAWDEAERFDLLVLLWRLALSDAHLDRFEEHMIRRIAELLYLSHSRFIEAKRVARAQPDVEVPPPRPPEPPPDR